MAIASILVGLLFAEVSLRVLGLPSDADPFLSIDFGTGQFVRDPQRFWRLAPEDSGYRANELGLRGFLSTRGSLEREWRLLCVGDSTTFGFAVRSEDAFGVRLGQLVQRERPGRVVRSTLFALPGYSTYQNRVLVERQLDRVQPDVTVFCCGAWNDFVPAMDVPDAELAARQQGLLRATRVGRLFAGVIDAMRPTIAEDTLRESFREGKAPHGRRVPIDAFRANLTAMIQAVRARGSEVLVVLPPLRADTIERFPVALEYRRAAQEIAESERTLLLDAMETFRRFERRCPKRWRRDASGRPLLFHDWTHPSTVGHHVLADALLAKLRDSLPDTMPAPTADGWRVEAVGELVALAGGRIEIHGPFVDAVAVENVRLGRHWLRDVRMTDGHLVASLPETVEPGRHDLCVSTTRGLVVLPDAVEIAAPPFRVDVKLENGALLLKGAVTGPPGWNVGLWLGDAIREQPTRTFAGDFRLQADPDGRPPGRADLPFRFDLLPLPAVYGKFDAAGQWLIDQRLELELPSDLQEVYLQCGIGRGPSEVVGALTRVVTQPLTR